MSQILIAEDETMLRAIAVEMLEDAGFSVFQAGDGEEAVDMLERHHSLDLLLTDVHLPGRFNGVDVALYARARHPDLPVVFATGRPETLKSFGKLGLREVCLAKPFSPIEALTVVERLLQVQPESH